MALAGKGGMNMGRKKKDIAGDVSEAAFDERETLIVAFLNAPLSLSQLIDRLDDPQDEAAGLMIDEWRRLAFMVGILRDDRPDEPLPGPADAGRFLQITELLTTWLDACTAIDPTPLLESVRARAELGEWKDPVPLNSDIPGDAWLSWEGSANRAELTLWRARLWLRKKLDTQPTARMTKADREKVQLEKIQAAIALLGLHAKSRDIAKCAGVSRPKVIESQPYRKLMGIQRGGKRDSDARHSEEYQYSQDEDE